MTEPVPVPTSEPSISSFPHRALVPRVVMPNRVGLAPPPTSALRSRGSASRYTTASVLLVKQIYLRHSGGQNRLGGNQQTRTIF
ncbi:hypothetical protein VTK26DRAFT_9486 [Humicola hyalothermophila]